MKHVATLFLAPTLVLGLAACGGSDSARDLDETQSAALVKALRKVLLAAIDKGGSTISDFRHPDGGVGGYQQSHRVYGKEGEPCPRCKTPIVRVVIAQRSSHFCPKCQR